MLKIPNKNLEDIKHLRLHVDKLVRKSIITHIVKHTYISTYIN